MNLVTKHTLKLAARSVFYRAGGLNVVRQLQPKGLRILMYHRFPAGATQRKTLERQCSHLVEQYELVPLKGVRDMWAGGKPLRRHALAITVDDGYRDFFQHAYPVFRSFNIPVTVFLTTDFIDRKSWMWVDQIEYLFSHTAVDHVDISLSTGKLDFKLNTAQAREAAASSVREALKRVSDLERRELMSSMCDELRVVLPEEPPGEHAPLNWDEVRIMAQQGIEFGAHTLSHPILSRLADDHALRSEIAGSKQRIEEELQRPVVHFCYPNGKADDFDGRVIEATRQTGFETAVSTEPGLNLPGDDLFSLKRTGVGVEYSEYYFQACAAGFRS
jgi:peptidoglycan/xylan/chitin deacetylase (PgdA/CDA1 family)